MLVFLDQLAGFLDDRLLPLRDDDVILAEGDAGLGRLAEAQAHHLVGEDHRRLLAAVPVDGLDQVADFLLGEVLLEKAVPDGGVLREQGNDLHPTRCGFDHPALKDAIRVHLEVAGLDPGVKGDDPRIEGGIDLAQVGEQLPLTGFTVLGQGQVVEPQDDVLGRDDDRTTVGGREDVVGRHHQNARLQLGLKAQRDVDGHLVAVEVGIEGSADQRV